MSTTNFAPKIWAATILRTLEDNLVGKKICNMKFTGEIKKMGDAVYFNGLADPTIFSYTGADISYEALQDSRITLIVDTQDAFAFEVDDVEAAQAEMDIEGSQAQRAAYGLQEACDTNIMKVYSQAGKTISAATVTSANVLSVLGLFKKKLAESNVRTGDMWIVLPPWFQLKLELAGVKFQINNGINGKGGMDWAKVLGMTVYISNQVVNTGTEDSPVSQIMAGSKMAIAFAEQILDTETLRLEKKFKTAIRGLHTYGIKCIKPQELVTCACTEGAETAI